MRDDDYVRLVLIGSFTYLLKSISLIQIIYFSSILDLTFWLKILNDSMASCPVSSILWPQTNLQHLVPLLFLIYFIIQLTQATYHLSWQSQPNLSLGWPTGQESTSPSWFATVLSNHHRRLKCHLLQEISLIPRRNIIALSLFSLSIVILSWQYCILPCNVVNCECLTYTTEIKNKIFHIFV